MTIKTWEGTPPVRCELCAGPLDGQFVDGKMCGSSVWANMCLDCHHEAGVGLGIGKGQRYRLMDDGRWVKIEG